MRETIQLECSECKRRNYTASRNKKLKQKEWKFESSVDGVENIFCIKK